MNQLAGRGIESSKPKQTVANSPAAWPLPTIVNVQPQDYYHDHSLHTSFLIFSELTIGHSSTSLPLVTAGNNYSQKKEK